MKKSLSKSQAKEKANEFFKQETFTPKKLKKIKRLAMKYNIKLKNERKLFCKKCFHKLKGKTRITKHYKTITCNNCQYKNRHKI